MIGPRPCSAGTRATVGPLASGWRVGLGYGPAAIDVSGSNPDDGAWLADFLGPWCDPIAPEQAAIRVCLTRSDQQMAILERGLAGRSTTLFPCFALETRTIALPGRRAGDRLCLVDRRAACFLVIEGAQVEIVAAADGDQCRLALARVVRELIAGWVLAAETILDFHAAAFAIGGKGVLIAGPKEAGKTTLLCHALLSGGATLLGNDRAFVQGDRPGTVVQGVPTIITLRPGTQQFFPQLQSGPAAAEPLTPAAFARRLGAVMAGAAVLHAIVLPERTTAADGWSQTRLSEQEAAAGLALCLYGKKAGRTPTLPTVLAALAPVVHADRTPATVAALHRLAADVPVYRCAIGPALYAAPASRWLRTLDLEPAAR